MMDFTNGQLMKILVAVCLLHAAFSQDYDYPTYSEDDLPYTSFSCEDKIHGGYYADIETGCQMYHICHRDKYGVKESSRFLCGNTTVFDQRKMVCQDYRKVNCKNSVNYYRYARPYEIENNRVKLEQRYQAMLRAAEAELHYDYPTYSEHNLPDTRFSCEDKTHGSYYADIETDCQMYHICSRDKFGVMENNRFLCGNGTLFDQRKHVCEEYRKVNCKDSVKYYKMARPEQILNNRMKMERRDQEMLRAAQLASAQVSHSQNYDYPNYSELDFPDTSFSCRDKTNGGYYADMEADCQMYHVCSRDKFGTMRSTRFLCGNGTVFDQRHLVCQDHWKVTNCKDSARYYRNAASALEYLEARLKSEKKNREIAEAAKFDSGRLN